MELHSRFQDLLLEKEDHLCLEWIDALRVVLIVGERNAKEGPKIKKVACSGSSASMRSLRGSLARSVYVH